MENDRAQSAEEIVRRMDAIKARCEAATAGPWHHESDYCEYVRDEYGFNVCMLYCGRDGDPAFIAHAREDIPYLLQLVETQAAEIAELRGQLAISKQETRAAVEDLNKSCPIEERDDALAQLSASQQETRAAVEDILIAYRDGRCAVCMHMRSRQQCQKWPNRDCFEWRGPQEESFISKTIDGVETAVVIRRDH